MNLLRVIRSGTCYFWNVNKRKTKIVEIYLIVMLGIVVVAHRRSSKYSRSHTNTTHIHTRELSITSIRVRHVITYKLHQRRNTFFNYAMLGRYLVQLKLTHTRAAKTKTRQSHTHTLTNSHTRTHTPREVNCDERMAERAAGCTILVR